ncbi:hypothetical protein GLOTRDRAFT_97953 [Gloeophyllum trabeum ATCC 11539]|uniref:Uncharacterized protein n=1 Tax=Gloeophyllum trabeum (strain ATCC 11539 / FP-39264 / Madison 617) TaxID=670483 RepID=S7QNY8_GLOTA|nr:uncharacterized protein GLOTRDRAFT_97953 [Gloeophyllum trabeum ATCC 11539]EPQ61012.1 hypothetical protein GLOTRDRAFT_97953 [Gloeophyllum trabeum ATCC 11539]
MLDKFKDGMISSQARRYLIREKQLGGLRWILRKEHRGADFIVRASKRGRLFGSHKSHAMEAVSKGPTSGIRRSADLGALTDKPAIRDASGSSPFQSSNINEICTAKQQTGTC